MRNSKEFRTHQGQRVRPKGAPLRLATDQRLPRSSCLGRRSATAMRTAPALLIALLLDFLGSIPAANRPQGASQALVEPETRRPSTRLWVLGGQGRWEPLN